MGTTDYALQKWDDAASGKLCKDLAQKLGRSEEDDEVRRVGKAVFELGLAYARLQGRYNGPINPTIARMAIKNAPTWLLGTSRVGLADQIMAVYGALPMREHDPGFTEETFQAQRDDLEKLIMMLVES